MKTTLFVLALLLAGTAGLRQKDEAEDLANDEDTRTAEDESGYTPNPRESRKIAGQPQKSAKGAATAAGKWKDSKEQLKGDLLKEAGYDANTKATYDADNKFASVTRSMGGGAAGAAGLKQKLSEHFATLEVRMNEKAGVESDDSGDDSGAQAAKASAELKAFGNPTGVADIMEKAAGLADSTLGLKNKGKDRITLPDFTKFATDLKQGLLGLFSGNGGYHTSSELK